MANINTPYSLKPLLLADAAVCTACGIVLAAGSGLIAAWTSLPEMLVFYAGLALLPIAVIILVVATRLTAPPFVWLVIAGNALWALASILLLFTGWIAPNSLGSAFIVVQAVMVAGFAAAEHKVMRGGFLAGLGKGQPAAR